MGLMTALALLLERWPSVRVYRLFVKIEDRVLENYQWSLADSQFDVDDWGIEGLNENVSIWGALSQVESRWSLRLEIENNLAVDDEANVVLVYDAKDLIALVNALPTVAADIADELGATGLLLDIDVSTRVEEFSLPALERLLKTVFEWEARLMLHLAGQTSVVSQIRQCLDDALETALALNDPFAGWLAAAMTARTMLPGFGELAEVAAYSSRSLVASLAGFAPVASLIASALFSLGRVEAAVDLLEGSVDTYPDHVGAWLVLAEIQRAVGKFSEAQDAFLRAIEADAVAIPLLVRYADLLLDLVQNDERVTDFILIDPAHVVHDRLLWEAIEAYQEALALDPDNAQILTQQLLRLIDANGEDRLWSGLEKLIVLDEEGDQVRSVIDALYNLDGDITPALTALETRLEAEPDNIAVMINLAAAYLIAEQGDDARHVLEDAAAQVDDVQLRADIDRLMLSARDAEFEAHFSELTQVVAAGNPLTTKDVTYLEDVIEAAPSFTDAYVLLARAYLIWEETVTATETLIDGLNAAPEDPEITALLARLLWDAEERALAFEYLNKAIDAHPTDVPLLALCGRLLFEDGQEDLARAYLLRAEAIAPFDPTLAETRVYIAGQVSRED
jgi:tetratricopeptide (TPR) repeat protein